MLECVSGRNTHIFVVNQHLSKQVEAFFTDAFFIIVVNECSKWSGFAVSDEVCNLVRQIESILAQILTQRFCAHHVDNASELVVIVRTLEKGIYLE